MAWQEYITGFLALAAAIYIGRSLWLSWRGITKGACASCALRKIIRLRT